MRWWFHICTGTCTCMSYMLYRSVTYMYMYKWLRIPFRCSFEIRVLHYFSMAHREACDGELVEVASTFQFPYQTKEVSLRREELQQLRMAEDRGRSMWDMNIHIYNVYICTHVYVHVYIYMHTCVHTPVAHAFIYLIPRPSTTPTWGEPDVLSCDGGC